jgi:hypothetical protein
VVTREEVIAAISADEPDYQSLAEMFGPDVTPIAEELASSPDPGLASRAASLAGYMEPSAAAGVVAAATRHASAAVRVAAAASLSAVGPEVSRELAVRMLADPEPGVRKGALHSLARSRPSGVAAYVRELAGSEPIEEIRSIANQVAEHLPPDRG